MRSRVHLIAGGKVRDAGAVAAAGGRGVFASTFGLHNVGGRMTGVLGGV